MRKLLEELFAVHYRDVYHYLYSLSRDAPLSEDLAQDVFVEAIKSIATFRGDANVKTWLFSIARNRWYSYLRKKSRQIETEALTEFMELPVSAPEEQWRTKELAQRIFRLLKKEPERTQKIVMLRLEGLSFFEIGEMTGISENSARVIDFRAKRKIRKILEEEGFACE